MIRNFHSSEHGHLLFVPGLPQGFKGPFLTGSTALHFSESFGSIVLQEIDGEEFTMRLLFFHFFQKIRITGSLPEGFQSLLAATGHSNLSVESNRQILLREFQFLLLQGTERHVKIDVRPRLPLHFLHTSYSSALTEEACQAFPTLQEFLRGTEKGVKGPVTSHGAIREAVHKILHADYEPERLPYFFKNRVGDYLFHLLVRTSDSGNRELTLSEWERKAIYKVRDLILADILKHHSIAELAKRVKINVFRLKYFFKKEFEVGPYEFLLNARLEKAKELMEGGMPMKQAAPLAGYRTTSFITAFKRKFGYPPGAITRRKQNDQL